MFCIQPCTDMMSFPAPIIYGVKCAGAIRLIRAVYKRLYRSAFYHSLVQKGKVTHTTEGMEPSLCLESPGQQQLMYGDLIFLILLCRCNVTQFIILSNCMFHKLDYGYASYISLFVLLLPSLCCECGTPIAPNSANMCVTCIRSVVDITEGIPKQATIFFCRNCERQAKNIYAINCRFKSLQIMSLLSLRDTLQCRFLSRRLHLNQYHYTGVQLLYKCLSSLAGTCNHLLSGSVLSLRVENSSQSV